MENDGFTIRKGTAEDIQRIFEINLELEMDQWTLNKFEMVFENQLTVWVACDVSGKIIGFLIYLICLDEARIINITVAKESRGMGVGKHILTHSIEDIIHNQHLHYVMLEVRADNFVALNMYTDLGFRLLTVRKDYYTDKVLQDAYLMQLAL
jgi:ribosomal-protein-alanine N-acetyltransferase